MDRFSMWREGLSADMRRAGMPRIGTAPFNCAFVLSTLFIATSPASALLSNDVCAAARIVSQKQASSWIGLNSRAHTVTAIKPGLKYRTGDLDTIIYMHTREDDWHDETVVGVKITMHTTGDYLDKDWVRAKNNYKRSPISVAFKDYQQFHEDAEEVYDLKTNFHLTSGEFVASVPFTTYEPSDRRRQLLLPPNNTGLELTYRVYLFTLTGVRDDGSCVDFQPFFPSSVLDAKLEAVDLWAAGDSGEFYRSTIKFDLGQ
jgi:hypothetical protein